MRELKLSHLAVACPSPHQQKRHLDQRRRTLPPQRRPAFRSCLPFRNEKPEHPYKTDTKSQATISSNLASYILCSFALSATTCTQESRSPMFLILAVVLIILWLGGFFVLHISSFLIHLLLIFAVISIIMNFVSGKRAV
jgi:hypothetical protein